MIIVSALDNSGQAHAADLVRALRTRLPHEQFVGVGGKDLAAAGCQLVHDISETSAMLTGVVAATSWAIPLYRELIRRMAHDDVKLVILVDSPTFNLPLAKAAKKRGIKTLYYIAPQVWAWAKFRVRRVRKRVDRLAVILPFEEPFFREHGIDATFVGHPFIHRVRQTPIDPHLSAELDSLPGPRILLMPGSRRGVVDQLLPVQLRLLQRLFDRFPSASAQIAAWPGLTAEIAHQVDKSGLDVSLRKLSTAPHSVSVLDEHRATLIARTDLALVASGTATLEVAWHGRPMIVMYNACKLMYHAVARWLIRTKHLSLINILAQQHVVPEFMPYIRDENEVFDTAASLLADPAKAEQLGRQLRQTLAPLETDRDPADKTADLALDLINR